MENMDNNILIQFHGMGYTRSEQLENWLESLMRHSPSESACRMHIFKDSHGYLCKLTVHSSRKTFSSQFKDRDLISAVKYVLKNVKKQVATWKKNRSTMELTGLISVHQLQLDNLDERSKPRRHTSENQNENDENYEDDDMWELEQKKAA